MTAISRVSGKDTKDMVAIAPLRIHKQTVSSPPPTPLPQLQNDQEYWIASEALDSASPRPPAEATSIRTSQEHPKTEGQIQASASSKVADVSDQARLRRPEEESLISQAILPPTIYQKVAAVPKEQTGHPRGGLGNSIAKPLPDSPGPDLPDKDMPYTVPTPRSSSDEGDTLDSISTTVAHQYYPTPVLGGQSRVPASSRLLAVQDQSSNRLLSTASISTTKATRGSPPLPETPLDSGTQDGTPQQLAYPFTARNHHAQSGNERQTPSSAQQLRGARSGDRAAVSGDSPQTNLPSMLSAQSPPRDVLPRSAASPQPVPVNQLEQDLGRIHIEDPAPPAYTTMQSPASSIQEEKAFAADRVEPLNLQGHPAFTGHQEEMERQQALQSIPQHLPKSTPSPPPVTKSTPPPLPEGWISHLDQKSGQYYYIHLPSQSTQWEFPKGPTPINLAEPQSPGYAGSMYSASVFDRPLGSPGFKPQYATYPQSLYSSMTPLASPTAAGFLQPPPSAGLEQFRIIPANGVYFGPYLRYTNMDLDNGVWHGSVMLIAEVPQPPTIHLHQSMDLSPNPRQLIPDAIHKHLEWTFYRYDIDIRMEETGDTKWTYAITSHLGCTRYEFVVAGRYDISWRFLAHSGNDFSINVNMAERTKLGGLGTMWKDVLQKNREVGGFHVQLGVGNQIVADRIWKDIPSLRQWTAMSGKDNRKNFPWSAQIEDEIRHAYFHYYTSHFDQAHLREAFASIPHILTIDDHEIFEGYGSYPPHLQSSNIFLNIGRCAHDAYLLFQHHTTPTLLRSPPSFATKTSPSTTFDLFTITGTGWHFLKYLGPAIVVMAPDCRSERTLHQVLAGATYQGLFPKIALLPPCVQHVLWLLPTPVVYPRGGEMAESMMAGFKTGKKVVTGSFNALGKVAGGVASVVGAKGVVTGAFGEVKRAVGKGGLMSAVLSPFGEVGGVEAVRDMWFHESKDLERTYLIRTLQTLAHQKSIRMTFLSGGTNCAAAGLLHDPNDSSATASSQSAASTTTNNTTTSLSSRSLSSPYFPLSNTPSSTTFTQHHNHSPSHRTTFALTTPPIVNAPPSSTTLRLNFPSHTTHKPIFIPANGTRSSDSRAGSTIPSDTKEDMLDVFNIDVDGRAREGAVKGVLERRGWVCGVVFDPVFVRSAFSGGSGVSEQGSQWGAQSTAGAGAGSVVALESQRGSWGGTSMSTLTANGAYDSEQVAGRRAQSSIRSTTTDLPGGGGSGRISLAFDFMMQAEPGLSPLAAAAGGGGGATVKYGPIVVPGVEYGR